jgi:hypothetical protein
MLKQEKIEETLSSESKLFNKHHLEMSPEHYANVVGWIEALCHVLEVNSNEYLDKLKEPTT